MPRTSNKTHVIRNHTKRQHFFPIMGVGVKETAQPKVDPDTGKYIQLDTGDYLSEVVTEEYPVVVKTLELPPTLKASKPGLLEIDQTTRDFLEAHPVYSAEIDAGWYSIAQKNG